jgi:hypothetical protein
MPIRPPVRHVARTAPVASPCSLPLLGAAVAAATFAVALGARDAVAHEGEGHAPPQLNVLHVRYDATGTGLSVLASPQTLGLLQGGGGLSFHVSDRPFALYDHRDRELWAVLIQSMVGLDFHGAIGFGPVDVGIRVPVAPVIVWGDDPTNGDFPLFANDVGAMGDLALLPKLRLLDPAKKRFGLGVQVPVSFPTGMKARFFGDNGVTVALELLAELRLKRLRGLLNWAPIHLRPKVDYGEFSRQVGMDWKLGVAAMPSRTLEVRAEAWGTLSYVGTLGRATAEWSASLGLKPSDEVTLEVGAGTGIAGLGTPQFRAFAAVRLTSPDRKDSDGDGVRDAQDACPEVAEDLDGWDDEDGCPDGDNDQDGIPDASDKCPNDAENRGVGEDLDGCPELEETPPAEPQAPEPEPAAGEAPPSAEPAPVEPAPVEPAPVPAEPAPAEPSPAPAEPAPVPGAP